MTPPADGWDRDERDALEAIEDELTMLRGRHANDPPLELLRAADADALPGDLQARVSEHLAGSDWSRALVAGARDVDHSMDAASVDRLLARITQAAKPQRERVQWRRFLASLAATAATLAVVAVAWTTWRGPRGDAPSTPVRPSVPESTVARSEPPPAELPLQKPDVRLSVAALTWRGSTTGASLVDDLAPALDAYRQSDYARAAQMLGAIEPRYPDAFDPPYYRGLSLLLLNDAAGAVPELQKAARLADATFAADVNRYLTIARQRAAKPATRR